MDVLCSDKEGYDLVLLLRTVTFLRLVKQTGQLSLINGKNVFVSVFILPCMSKYECSHSLLQALSYLAFWQDEICFR